MAGKIFKNNNTDYNLGQGEDLETELKHKRIFVTCFISLIIIISFSVRTFDKQDVKEIIKNTVIEPVSSVELRMKIANNKTDTSLIVVTRNKNEICDNTFRYILRYFENLNGGGNIYYYDDSNDWMLSENSESKKETFDKNKKEIGYNYPATFYILDKGEIKNKYESSIMKYNLDEKDSINKKIIFREEVFKIYNYLDGIYGMNIGERLKPRISSEILHMKLDEIKKEPAINIKETKEAE